MRARIQSWRTFWSLSRAERKIAGEAARGLAATWLGLRLFGFQRWKSFMVGRVARSSSGPQVNRTSGIAANRILQLEAAAARSLFFETNCLEQSLVLWSILRRNGFAADLKIGGRKETGRFEAHAWVELNGIPLNDQTDAAHEFVPFDGALAAMETQSE